MSEESRLGRESIETAYALKQLVTSGVRLFFYLEDHERTLDSPVDKIMLSVTTFADEVEREKARQRTYDAMRRKALAGQVTGGRVFGYDNVRTDAGPVVRVINEAEATVVRRIFELYVEGAGQSRIAKRLNEDGAVAPRSQQGRPRAWAPSSVHEVLERPLYRGRIVWNRTRKRDQWGQRRQQARPAGEWLEVSRRRTCALSPSLSGGRSRPDARSGVPGTLRRQVASVSGDRAGTWTRNICCRASRAAPAAGVECACAVAATGDIASISTDVRPSGSAAAPSAPTASKFAWTTRMRPCSQPWAVPCWPRTSAARWWRVSWRSCVRTEWIKRAATVSGGERSWGRRSSA